ncbi:leucyl-tRNA synthetase [Coniosporium apollinis CBS 100218]|uniref:leucine--tRNA ligase n=1 Tax=Coniosporium apollinis (strain CBS 100218) TaxID=1168221 RepID=R7YSC6_CONA1|nr:leucyl-tRNA synthetase [Coniosporium apollinis CBS 100218]EON64719.1 leucyl-tRNA synthetase [Coniosporium apollinis CBS 100218]
MAALVDGLDPTSSSQKTLKIENTEKRDTLIAAEQQYQKKWQDEGVFDAEAPSTAEVPFGSMPAAELRAKHPKWLGSMAYPVGYLSRFLTLADVPWHAGHAFTASKVEFAAGFARMQGKRTIFPLGFHCTGMPIKTCADKLVREIEMFGEKFEGYGQEDGVDGEVEEPPAPTNETKTDITKFTAKKGKANAKARNANIGYKAKYQFQIMLALGIPLEEIHEFADPAKWLQYFPPLCKRDLNSFGARITWKRSFVTTDANPYYDAFVRWQMNRLKELNKIKFGKRFTVYSPKDGQACMDHDRSTGEGVGTTEYVAIKQRVLEWAEPARKKLADALPADAKVSFVSATLRPETMYGQVCVFVGPGVTYGIFKAGSEYLFLSPRAAREMAFQSIFPKWGEFPQVAELQGSDVVGTLVNAPLSVHKDGVRILPMESVKPTKGTGVVTSVPSDSPDDYATITDLAKKADYYGIKKEWAELEIIPIIETPSYGNLTAPFLVKEHKINSPKDATQLALAKDLAYKAGFYEGTMIYGDFKGKSVQEAKPLVREALLDSGDAFVFADIDGLVISRSGDECVAAHLDQWYLNYGTTANGGDGEWCDAVHDHLNGELNTFSSDTKNQFEQTLGWLSQWACARSYGLGSKLPWDPKFLVESLSDSTIYMSYYTVAHLLHNDIFGRQQGQAKVGPEEMTDEIWDYIFARSDEMPSSMPQEKLQMLRRSFEYWYPADLRVSGKDLIQNHLTFFLYIHVALWPKEYLPRAIRANGHLLLNGQKMSKSTGNFLTLSQAVEKFGADATRIALADAGDGIDDANFDETVANSSILKLYELRKWCEEMVNDAILRTGPKDTIWDQMFENEMNALVQETKQHYDKTDFKLALKSGFYDFTAARDFYREATKAANLGMHSSLTRRYIELQALLLTPIAPHWAEQIWLEVLKHPSTIQNALWPSVSDPSPSLNAAREYVRATSSNINSAEGQQQKKIAKGKNVSYDPKKEKKLTIFMARKYPAWQDKYIDLVREAFDGLSVDVKALTPRIEKKEMKKAMPFVQNLKRRLEGGEGAGTVFERKLAFDEVEVLRCMVPILKQNLGRQCRIVEIISVEEGGESGVVAGAAVPGSPSFSFENL